MLEPSMSSPAPSLEGATALGGPVVRLEPGRGRDWATHVALAAWEGPLDAGRMERLHIEAASWQGKPVFFSVGGDWQALIVGTSRAEVGIDPRHSYFSGLRCFNAALESATRNCLRSSIRFSAD